MAEGERRLEETSTYSEEDASAEPHMALAIRWVFPLPVAPATWLDRSELTLGRDPSNSVAIESRYVSRLHARIQRSGALHLVSGQNPKNGVWLDGEPVSEGVLTAGTVLRIGDWVGVCVSAPPQTDLGLENWGHGIWAGHLHRKALSRVAELARTDLPVVIEGATGTGKELVARALHDTSGRSGPFFAVNCAAYSKAMGAAELFGYRRGAFTGAEKPSSGHVRAAEAGTLLLDELLDLPLDVQTMLLRVLENSELVPLGETRAVPIDVRFVAATQLPLRQAVELGRIRPDLRARLEGGVVRLPSLRDCREIVPELFAKLFERSHGRRVLMTAGFAEELCLRDWPLNVRELDKLARRAALDFRDQALARSFLDTRRARGAAPEPEPRETPRQSARPQAPGARPYYASEELQALLRTLSTCDGNLTRAASLLGVTRQKAYRMLRAVKREGAA